jgi:hypothetical protein
MTKKRTTQDATKDADHMAYIAGRQAAREAIDAMVGLGDFKKASAILTHCFEENRTFANPHASRGAAEQLTTVLMLTISDGFPAELSFKRAERVAMTAIERITDPGTSYDLAAMLMEEALLEVIEKIPNKTHSIKGFADALSTCVKLFLSELTKEREANHAKS